MSPLLKQTVSALKMKASTVTQSRPPLPRQQQSEKWPSADIIGGYLACMAALFAACVALVNLKGAVWGFVLFHIGCTLTVFVWWWRDTQRGNKTKPLPEIKQEQNVAGTLLTEHAASIRR